MPPVDIDVTELSVLSPEAISNRVWIIICSLILKRIFKLPSHLQLHLYKYICTYLSDGGTTGHAAHGKSTVVKVHIWHHDGPLSRTSLFGTSCITIKLVYAHGKVCRSVALESITHIEGTDRFINAKTHSRLGNHCCILR